MTYNVLEYINHLLVNMLFFDIFGIPAVILWMLLAGVFFTLYLKFVNITLFPHAISILRGKYAKEEEHHSSGSASQVKVLLMAISGTVGLGNIAGVAVAIQMGGPGAVVWMILSGFFAMSLKYAEVVISHKYRTIDGSGQIIGGPFVYLRKGLADIGLKKTGNVLAILFSIIYLVVPLGPGGIFQASQTATILANDSNSILHGQEVIILVIMMSLTFLVTLGGIARISNTASKISIIMTTLYIISCLTIIVTNSGNIMSALGIIFHDAMTGEAVSGSILGTAIIGVQRAAFASEAGLGSTAIEHAIAKTKEPVREGCMALLEPFIGTVIICSLTGIIVVITEAYKLPHLSGILITEYAFRTVSDWFAIFLSASVALFAFSTIITNCYHGERAWVSLFKSTKYIIIYRIIFSILIFLGSLYNNFTAIMNFCDFIYLFATIPNIISLYLLARIVKQETKSYEARYMQK